MSVDRADRVVLSRLANKPTARCYTQLCRISTRKFGLQGDFSTVLLKKKKRKGNIDDEKIEREIRLTIMLNESQQQYTARGGSQPMK